jgi:DNA-directed RNA polymerase specialized sigma24 family protein
MSVTNDIEVKKKTIKRFLESSFFTNQEIAVKKKTYDELTALASEFEVHGASEKVERLKTELKNDVAGLLALKTKVKDIIVSIADPRVRVIFEARFMKGMNWEEIADMMFYSIGHVKRLAVNGYNQLAEGIIWDEL